MSKAQSGTQESAPQKPSRGAATKSRSTAAPPGTEQPAPGRNSGAPNHAIKLPIIHSNQPPSNEPAAGWRRWQYAKAYARFDPFGADHDVTPDTGASCCLVDRAFIKTHIPNATIQRGKTTRVKGIGDDWYDSSEYITITLYFRAHLPNGSEVLAAVPMSLRIVNGLEANVLIGMDVLGPEGAILNMKTKQMILPRCQNACVPMRITPRSSHPPKIRKILAFERTVIPRHTAAFVRFCTKGGPLPDYDLEFQAMRNTTYAARGYNAIINANSHYVLFRNDSDRDAIIQRRANLGYAKPLDIDGAYHAHEQLAIGAALSNPGSEETITDIGVTIYGDKNSETVRRLAALIREFPQLFTDRGSTVDIPPENHMRVPLIPGWENVKLNIKPFDLTPEEQKIVDELFDKLHLDGKMSWAQQGTHFGCPVFVVWKTVVDKDGNITRKGRPVIDQRALNEAVVKDSYPLRKQTDILRGLKGATHISVIDGVSFFYQWLVAEQDRHKMAINSHRGQELIHVLTMGYINSIQHVQRQMENIMRDFPFVRVYIDDFIIYSNSLDDHEKHLRQVFKKLDTLRFSLAAKKSFLGYPSVTMLGQKVDALGLASTDERMKAMRDLQFPHNAHLLETYIGATGFLRDKTPYYAQLAGPLQDLKTVLLKNAPNGKYKRKRFGENISIAEEPLIRAAFDAIQNQFKNNMKLFHQDTARPLYADVDASKEYGIAAFLYHVDGDPEPVMEDVPAPKGFEGVPNGPTAWLKKVKDWPERSIQPILFLSKRLSPAERNYWPTELEMSGVVWLVKKTRHIIAAAPKCYIFTDHSAVTAIANQKLLTSSSADRLNLRLVRCAQYLQQFANISIRYRPGRNHLVPDALSRLQGIAADGDHSTNILDDLEHDQVHSYFIPFRSWKRPGTRQLDYAPIFNATLVAMKDDFKSQIIAAYDDDTHWKLVKQVINGERDEDTEPLDRPLRGLNFIMRDGLIYYCDKMDGSERLCIPKSLAPHIFRQAHDEQFHAGYHRTYERIRASVYIRKLSKLLRLYVKHCPACIQNRTERHPPYGNLEPIASPGAPYVTIAIDIVTGLPAGKDGSDALMTATCKQTKRILLIPGMTDWSASDWGTALIKALIDYEWGFPKHLISDRDTRFLNDLWRTMFEATGTTFLSTTAWHPQTDGQSERTNQTVEIALRYFCTANPDNDWTEALPFIKFMMNSSINASTQTSPMQQIQGFNPRDPLSALADLPPKNFEALRQEYRDMAQEALAFANINMKYRYDQKHKPLSFKIGDWVLLRLHHGYRVHGHLHRKLAPQRSSPLKIIGKVGKNAYRLELPENMKIHPVVSVAQLEPLPKGTDPFGRKIEARNEPVDSLEDDAPSYEIERFLGRRFNKQTGNTQYLVRWTGWGSVHNQWYDLQDLQSAKELVAEYDASNPETDLERAARDSFGKRRGRKYTVPPKQGARRSGRTTNTANTQAGGGPRATDLIAAQPPTVRRLLRVEIPRRRA